MNPELLSLAAVIIAVFGIVSGIAALTLTLLRKRRAKAQAVADARAKFEAQAAELQARDARRKLEADRIHAAQERQAAARKNAEEAALRPVRALIEDAAKPRVHNERKRPAPAPKNTTSRTVNGRNETGYYDDSGFWVMLAFNEMINHSYYETLRNEDPATPEPEKSNDYAQPEYSKTEYSTPDYSSSSDSSSSSSYDSGSSSSSSSDSGSSGGGGGE